MENKISTKQINNAETSASTETKNEVNMRTGTFMLPTFQEAQSHYDNIGAYNQLQKCTLSNKSAQLQM